MSNLKQFCSSDYLFLYILENILKNVGNFLKNVIKNNLSNTYNISLFFEAYKKIFVDNLFSVVLTKSNKRKQPKILWSCISSGLYVSLGLKNVTFLHSFCKWKHVGQAGPDLQFLLAVISIYDSRLTFLFLVGADRPAYLSKPEEFSLQLCLMEGGLLLPPGVKAISSMARCDSL